MVTAQKPTASPNLQDHRPGAYLPSTNDSNLPYNDPALRLRLEKISKRYRLNNEAKEIFIKSTSSTIITQDKQDNIARGLQRLSAKKTSKEVWSLFTELADYAIQLNHGHLVGYIADTLNQLKANYDTCIIFAKLQAYAIKAGQMSSISNLAPSLKLISGKADYDTCLLFTKIAIYAIKASARHLIPDIASGLSELKANKANYDTCLIFAKLATYAIKARAYNSIPHIANGLSQLAKAKIDTKQVGNLVTMIIALQSQSSHKANQVDLCEFFHIGLPSAFKLELISSKIHKSLINDLKQRKNPLIYHETIKICHDLNENDIKKLKTFLQSKRSIFDNHQQFFLKVIAYYKIANSLGVDILDQNPTLSSISDSKELAKYFASLIIAKFADSINIDPNIDYEKALENWDTENFASFMAIKQLWSEEDRELFELLSRSILSNCFDDVLELMKEPREQLTQDMITHGLDAEAWFDAHIRIPETSFSPNSDKVAIWDPMDIGRNLFVATRVNSCMAVGPTSSAILKFIIDPGTKYIYVKNSKDNITGYARIFLALDFHNKPKIVVDTVDAKANVKRDLITMIPEVKTKIVELAKLIGLKDSDIVNRTVDLSYKLGGMPKGYHYLASFRKSSAQIP